MGIVSATGGCADDTTAQTDTESTSTGTGGGSGDTTSPTTSPMTTVADGSSSGMGSSGTGSVGSSGDTTAGSSSGETTATASGTETEGNEESSTSGSVFVCDPIDLGSVLGEVHTGSTVGESNDLLVDCVKFDSVEREFAWTAPVTGTYQIDTLGSSYDTALMVLAEDCFGTQLACNDDFGELQSAVLVDVAEGETIVVVVDGYGGGNGEYVLNIVTSAPGDCCEPGFFGGCDDDACETLVCAVDPECCTGQWDAICALNYAPTLCAQCAEPDSCCFPQKDGGCNDPMCETDVCAIDASCCDTEWNQACADLAEQQCTTCIPLDCCSPHDETGCGDLSCEQIVCEQWDPWCCDQVWDESCVQFANNNCSVCQEQGPCCYANAGIGCEEPEVAQCVCDTMPECCLGQWTDACAAAVTDLMCGTCDPPDGSCVDFDLGSALGEVATGSNVGAGDNGTLTCAPVGGEEHAFTWLAPSTNTFTFDTVGSDFDTALSVRFPDCAGEEIGCTGFLGQMNSIVTLELVEGQPVVITLEGYGAGANGNYVLNINLPANEGFCCAGNFSVGCASATCEASVCDVQPSCCVENWDDSCGLIALVECAVCENLEDCCSDHDSPGCDDLNCAAQVCDFEPSCCSSGWSDTCIEWAFEVCIGVCEL
ncbi:MAG: hypothetical protein JKY37_28750 [Nannocystaceae bacterium]|nr:hypothetical protein [Nannocystaceae bacterium]